MRHERLRIEARHHIDVTAQARSGPPRRWGMIHSMSSAHRADDATASRSSRDNARRVAIGILAAVALLFAVLNFDSVTSTCCSAP